MRLCLQEKFSEDVIRVQGSHIPLATLPARISCVNYLYVAWGQSNFFTEHNIKKRPKSITLKLHTAQCIFFYYVLKAVKTNNSSQYTGNQQMPYAYTQTLIFQMLHLTHRYNFQVLWKELNFKVLSFNLRSKFQLC